MEKKATWFSLFTEHRGGKPIIIDGNPMLNKNGGKITYPDFVAKFKVEYPIESGEYEIKFYPKTSSKGNIYYSGTMKAVKAFPPISEHQKQKADGYQPQAQENDDEIPF